MRDAPTPATSPLKGGLTLGLSAYLLWGLLPIFFKQFGGINPFEVIAQRILWSLVVMVPVVLLSGSGVEFARILRSPRLIGVLAASSVAIAINWSTYVVAVMHGHVLAASLGYFLSPLLNVVLGRLVFSEAVSRQQWAAVGIAALGTGMLALGALDTLWVSLVLTVSWGLYATIRKLAPVGAISGLAIETLLLAPVALGYAMWLCAHDAMVFGSDLRFTALFMLAGIVTSLPLVLFTAAARKIPLSLLGLLQYIAPSLQFLCGALIYAEPLNYSQLACFGLIWVALVLFTGDALKRARQPQPTERSA